MIPKIAKKIIGKDNKKLRISVLLASGVSFFTGCELVCLFMLSSLLIGTNMMANYPLISQYLQGFSKIELITNVGLFFAGVTVLRFICHLGFYRFTIKLGANLTSRVQSTLMNTFLNSPTSVFDKNNPGQIIHGLMEAPFGVTFAIDAICGLIINGFTVLLVSFTLILLSPWLLLASIIVSVPTFFVIILPLQTRLRKQKNTLVHERTVTTELASKMIGGIRDIKSLYAESKTTEVFASRVKSGLDAFANARFIKILPGPTLQTVFQCTFALAIVVMASTLSGANLESYLPQFAVVGFGMLKAYPAITNVSRSWLELQNALPDLEIVDKWNSLPYDSLSEGSEEFQSNDYSGISFSNVTFSYDGQTPVLSDLNFTIKPGIMTCFVGGSGGGKSSIIDLILKFRSPEVGEIKIGNQLLDQIIRKTWLDKIAVVRQEVYLFSGTIRANFKSWNNNATETDMLHACNKAGALSFIKDLPQGLDTVIGDRGVTVSGGQRQRIAIARAILRKPELLILDEALSALDGEIETNILKTIKEDNSKRTIILVSHRLASLKNSDWIIVLNQGQIVEEGTFADLIKTGDRFKRLFASQLSQYN